MVSARKGVANLGTTKRNYVCRVFFSISHFLQLLPPLLIHSSTPLLLAETGHMRTRFVGSLVLGNWLMTKLRHVPSQHNKGQHLSHLSTSLASPSPFPGLTNNYSVKSALISTGTLKRQRHVRCPLPALNSCSLGTVSQRVVLCCKTTR